VSERPSGLCAPVLRVIAFGAFVVGCAGHSGSGDSAAGDSGSVSASTNSGGADCLAAALDFVACGGDPTGTWGAAAPSSALLR
jgi:hypothetical protein